MCWRQNLVPGIAGVPKAKACRNERGCNDALVTGAAWYVQVGAELSQSSVMAEFQKT